MPCASLRLAHVTMQAELVGDPRTCNSSYTRIRGSSVLPLTLVLYSFLQLEQSGRKKERKKNNRDFAYNLQIPGALFLVPFGQRADFLLGFRCLTCLCAM